MTYSAKDLERWTSFLEDKSHGQEVPTSVGAQLIADVRREALEEAAHVCDPFMRNEALSAKERTVAEWIHARIRALKDGAK